MANLLTQVEFTFLSAEQAGEQYTLGELAELINGGQERIATGLRYSAMQVCQSGAYLTAVKSLCNHGEWLFWLAENCPEISQQTISNYMRLYEKIGANYQLISNLTPTQAYKQLDILKESTKTLVGKFTGNQENYTPRGVIDAVRGVLGSIDLDPASCEKAQEIVQANEYFTEEDDGLSRLWNGNVFLNPPYQMPQIRQFTDKLIEELPHVTSAILLTNNNTDTQWFHKCAEKAKIICFTKGRINFYTVEIEETQPTNGQTFFYFGNNEKLFIQVFGNLGILMKAII